MSQASLYAGPSLDVDGMGDVSAEDLNNPGKKGKRKIIKKQLFLIEIKKQTLPNLRFLSFLYVKTIG